jgi:GDP-mannose 4,6-dehydratase
MLNKCLITGIAGMVGSHLADYLLENTDWEIYGFCRWNENFSNIKHLFSRINNKDRIQLLYGDLNDYSSVLSALTESNPDYVFHLAAQSYPKTSFSAPIETLQTNIIGTANLLQSIHDLKIDPVIHVCASSEIFGRVSRDELPINEECKFHPASPYAISKVGTDLLGRFYAEAYCMKIMTTRMFTHTGPRRGDVFAESTFAKQIAMIEAGLIEPTIKVGNLDSLRTWADVRDAVRAYYILVTHNPVPGEYYNIGGTFTCSIREMLDHLLSLSKVKNISIQIDPERLRPIDADLQVPDTSKFTNHTGWKPEIEFSKTMKDLLEYWRKRISEEKTCLTR